MAFSLDSKVKDILKNPAAAAVLDKFFANATADGSMKACAEKYGVQAALVQE